MKMFDDKKIDKFVVNINVANNRQVYPTITINFLYFLISNIILIISNF